MMFTALQIVAQNEERQKSGNILFCLIIFTGLCIVLSYVDNLFPVM